MSRVTRARSSGARTTLHRAAALAQGEGGGGDGAGKGGEQERPTGRPAGQEPRDTQAEEQVGAEKDLEEGHRGGLEGGEGQVPAVVRLLHARQGDDGAEDEAEGGDDRVRVGEREQEVPAQEIGPPVGLRVPGKDEGEIREEEGPGHERDRQGRGAEAGGHGAQGQDETERPQGHVEAGQGVPGIGAGPAQGRGAHEVGAEVVAEREPGDPGNLGRVADHQLVREPHVESGVEGHQRVEKKVAGRIESVAPVLREREQAGHGEKRGECSPEGWPGGAPPGPERNEQRSADERGGPGEEPGPVGDEAEPVSRCAPGSSEGDDQGRLDRGAGEPLQGEAGEADRDGGEEEPGEKVESVQVQDGKRVYTSAGRVVFSPVDCREKRGVKRRSVGELQQGPENGSHLGLPDA